MKLQIKTWRIYRQWKSYVNSSCFLQQCKDANFLCCAVMQKCCKSPWCCRSSLHHNIIKISQKIISNCHKYTKLIYDLKLHWANQIKCLLGGLTPLKLPRAFFALGLSTPTKLMSGLHKSPANYWLQFLKHILWWIKATALTAFVNNCKSRMFKKDFLSGAKRVERP